MDIEHVNGTLKGLSGRMRMTLGHMLGREDLAEKGRRDMAEGKVRMALGDSRVSMRKEQMNRR